MTMKTGQIHLWEAWKSVSRHTKVTGRMVLWPVAPSERQRQRGQTKSRLAFKWFDASSPSIDEIDEYAKRWPSRVGPIVETTLRQVFRKLLGYRLEHLRTRLIDEPAQVAGSRVGSLFACLRICAWRLYEQHKKDKQDKKKRVGSINDLVDLLTSQCLRIATDEANEATANTRNYRSYPEGEVARAKYGALAGQAIRIETSESDWRTREARTADREPTEVQEREVVPPDGGAPYLERKRTYAPYQPYKGDPAFVEKQPDNIACFSGRAEPQGELNPDHLLPGQDENFVVSPRYTDAAHVQLVQRIIQFLADSKSIVDQRLAKILEELREKPHLFRETDEKWTYAAGTLAEVFGVAETKIWKALSGVATSFAEAKAGPSAVADRLGIASRAEETDIIVTSLVLQKKKA
jgi:hypothetical protein